MNEPLISVIVPVYKVEAFLEQCVASVLGQDYREVELLLVDDGSPDSSGRICDALALKDKRVKVFHKANAGPSAARNLALDSAGGEFIFFLDADDLVLPGAFTTLVSNCLSTGADIAIGSFARFSDGVQAAQPAPAFPGARRLSRGDIADYAFSYLRAPNRNILFAYSWGRVFRAEIIRRHALRFDVSLHTFEDVAFNFDFLMHAAAVSYLPDLVYRHRIYDTFSSATMNIRSGAKRMFGYRTAIQSVAEFLDAAAPGATVTAATGHAKVSLTIIQLVRICGQLDAANREAVYELIREIVGDPAFQAELRYYSPSGKDSRLLPLLMRLRLYRLIATVCRYKAIKRYRKGGEACPAPEY